MFQALDILISASVIFLILSMVNKYLVSFLKRILKTKANIISKEMETFIGDKANRCLVYYLKNSGRPLNLLDRNDRIRHLSKEQLGKLIDDLKAFLREGGAEPFQQIFDMHGDEGEAEEKILSHFDRLKGDIEQMYDSILERISETYDSYIRYITLISGILLALIINADLFGICTTLSNDPIMRTEIALHSEKINQEMQDLFEKLESKSEEGLTEIPKEIKEAETQVTSLINRVESTGVILGWTQSKFNDAFRKGPGPFLNKIIGLLISGLLISFGAPFWHEFIGTFSGLKKTLKSGKGGTTPSTP